MAMDKDVLGAAIAERLLPVGAPDDFKAVVVDVWMKVADEVIKHIEKNTTFAGISTSIVFDVVVNRVGVGTATFHGTVDPPAP